MGFRLPESIRYRLAQAGLRLCRDVIAFGLGAVTACLMVGHLRRNAE